jgi:hypothetical protein
VHSHARPSEVLDVRPPEGRRAELRTPTIAKTTELELLRLVQPAGGAHLTVDDGDFVEREGASHRDRPTDATGVSAGDGDARER